MHCAGLSKILRGEATSSRPQSLKGVQSLANQTKHIERPWADRCAGIPLWWIVCFTSSGQSWQLSFRRSRHAWQFVRVDARGHCRRDVGTRDWNLPGCRKGQTKAASVRIVRVTFPHRESIKRLCISIALSSTKPLPHHADLR